MAPPRGGGKGAAEKVEARTVLQAVLLADSFTQRFRPITVERPKVLLPLVNVPMIEYTLEWLAMNRVQEVFVFCCAHADQITKYLQQESKWARSRDMVVTPVVSTSCLSVGEAMRIIDDKDVIHNDFVLVSGDTIANINLNPIIDAHKARRAVDKQAIFTMVMKSTQNPQQRLRMGDLDSIVVLDPTTNRLLKYTEYEAPVVAPGGGGGGGGGPKRGGLVKLDTALFSERDAVQVRADLMDTHIAICAPEVLMLFTDNFDFANLKRDFIPGVLSEEELGSKLYVHEVPRGEYAAHVHNLRSYDAVSRDILQRWAFPLVPDTNMLWRGGTWGQTTYRYARGHRYYEQSVSIQRTATLGEDVCVGAGTTIGEDSRVVQSVIGRDVRIGKNVDILGCYVQDGVVVEDGVVMRFALVCDNAVVKAGATLSDGTIISYNVVVGPRHTVPPTTRVSLCRQLQQAASLSDDELEYAPSTATPAASTTAARAPGPSLGGSGRHRAPHGAPPGGGGGGGDDDEEDGEDEEDEDSGLDEDDPLGASLEKPTSAALQAAVALAIGRGVEGAQAGTLQFDGGVVGPGGAGYRWIPMETADADRQLITMPRLVDASQQESEQDAELEAASDSKGNKGDGAQGTGASEDDEDEDEDGVGGGGARGPEHAALVRERKFKLEVSETLLRCKKLKFEQANANIELNGLKIAEDRSFADLAKYIFTTLLAMCLPAPAWVTGEYAPLFLPRQAARPGKLPLLTELRKLLREYKAMLKKFLNTLEDQEELLLTFEDYCSEQGVFSKQGEHGSAYKEVFGKVLELCYDEDILSEEGIEAWAAAKADDEEEDQEYLKLATGFLEWLRNADEEEEEDDD